MIMHLDVISFKKGFSDLEVLSHFAVLPDGALEKRQQGSQGCGSRQHSTSSAYYTSIRYTIINDILYIIRIINDILYIIRIRGVDPGSTSRGKERGGEGEGEEGEGGEGEGEDLGGIDIILHKYDSIYIIRRGGRPLL